MSKILILISLLAVTAVVSLASFHKHAIWEREVGTKLMWSEKEAYLVAARQREGWSGNLLELAWEIGRAYVGFAGNRTDRRMWLEVTRITGTGSAMTVVPDTSAFPLGIFENHLYATHNGEFSKWVGNKFVPVTAEEKSRFHRERQGSGEYRDVNGWSVEINIVRSPGESSYPFVLDGVPVIVRINHTSDQKTASVEFPGGQVQTLLDLHTAPTQMDEASYRRLFASEKIK